MICGLNNFSEIKVIPRAVRVNLYFKKNIYIPTDSRICRSHFLGEVMYVDVVKTIKLRSLESEIPLQDFILLHEARSKRKETIIERFRNLDVSQNRHKKHLISLPEK